MSDVMAQALAVFGVLFVVVNTIMLMVFLAVIGQDLIMERWKRDRG